MVQKQQATQTGQSFARNSNDGCAVVQAWVFILVVNVAKGYDVKGTSGHGSLDRAWHSGDNPALVELGGS
jgi:hypothetical protein